MLTEEQVALEAMVGDLAERKMRPIFEKAERDREFPRHVIAEFGKLGLLCMTMPESVGGAGATKLTECLVIRQLARVSSSLASTIMIHGGVATSSIALHGSSELQERYLRPAVAGRALAGFALTEPQAGSDAAAIVTRARLDGDHYMLNGRKTYITNGGIADFLTIAAVTDPGAKRGRGISLFVLERDTPGLETRTLRKVGHHAADTAELYLDDVRVPAASLIGSADQGFTYLKDALTGGRIVHAARSIGVAEEALRLTLGYTREREAFGAPLFENQSVAYALSEMVTETEAAWQLTLGAADLMDAGKDASLMASMAKLFAAEVAERVASRCMHLHGGFGYMDETEISRLWREAKLFPITEGASEVQKRIISRRLAHKA